MNTNHKRNPLTAAVLSFLVAGLGHLYIGHISKAIVFNLFGLILILLFATLDLYNSYIGLRTCVSIGLLYNFAIIIDAIIKSRKMDQYTLKKYNRWYIYLIIIFVYALIIAPCFGTIIGIKSYKASTGSMEPTVLFGDKFIVSTTYYHTNPIEKGDIVTFTPPYEADKKFIKRCVAIGGDNINVKNGSLYINDQLVVEPYVEGQTTYRGFSEKLIEGVVPKDSIVVLGDNRENSFDSRGFGYVPKESVTGKALYIYYSPHEGRTGMVIQ